MQLLPWQRRAELANPGDSTEVRVCIAVAYFAIACFFLQLLIAVHNIFAFLIRQGKYKTQPLLMFYLFTVAISVSRIVYNVFIFYEFGDEFFALTELMPAFDLALGIEQCWLMFELSLHINNYIAFVQVT